MLVVVELNKMQVLIIILALLQIFFIKTTKGFTCKATITSGNSREIPDYYWRDFHGDIPGDAVPGGTTSTGSTTYIGQAYIKDRELLPVTIYPNCINARGSTSDAVVQPEQNIKILCSNDISKFFWVTTTADTAPLITNCKFLIGGSEANELLNVGRVHYKDAIIIGKVYSYPSSNKGLWIPDETENEIRFLTYEILAYNCISKWNEVALINITKQ